MQMDKEVNMTDDEPNSSTTPDNVRNRVSVWLSGIVEEVRRKNPVRLQKLTESTDISPNSEKPNNVAVCTTPSIATLADVSTCEQELNDTPKIAINISESGSNQNRIWSAGTLLNKVRAFEGFHTDQEEGRLTVVGSIKSLGKAKINEFYDKVRVNRVRFDSMKKHNNMERSELTISELDVSDMHISDCNETLIPSSRSCFNASKEQDTSHSDSIEISALGDISLTTTRKTPLGIIGRSRTSCGYSSSTVDQVQTNHHNQHPHHEDHQKLQSLPESPTVKSTLAEKHLLGHIGRSFSEQNDDENDNSSFMLNERSRSYSHVVGERQATENSNHVSNSLPTFFGNNSVPVSPVPQHKGIISRGASLSESPQRRRSLLRDGSFQSDSSHCSSVESLLEARKPDPEAILVNLGFGPVHSEDMLSKIPKRFLKPSQVKGIDIDTFLRQQQMASHLHDHSVLGYRGLLGDPDIPPSLIVGKIMERFEQNERNRCIMDLNMNRPQSAPPTPGPNQI